MRLAAGALLLAVLAWLALSPPALPALVPVGSEAPAIGPVATWVVPAGALLPHGGRALVEGRDEVLLVEFWATWCPPCRATHPLLDELARAHAADGLRVVGVTIPDERQGLGEIQAYGRERAFPSAVLATPQAYISFGVEGIPYALLLDRQRRVRWRGQPLGDEGALRAALREALAAR
ncbi:MAG: TlpA family protein disulfide reductase [Planctomycetota bacterium]